mmetsp:Transcript_17629/g.43990  ORF Transcript_17629/g.43990 Transcript_17629/m.43990 type:complete len:330 (+) Transcript_17629:261-1250(+)
MAFQNSLVDDRRIPHWLKENCYRLKNEGENLRNLNLNIRRLNGAMILVLCEALRDNTRIETVNMTSSLSSTQRSKDAGRILIPLAYALRRHVSLKTIHLSYNQLKDATSLGVTLELNRSSLTELHLDHNRLDVNTAIALARALRRNNKLSILQLNSNRLGDEGGRIIAEALRDNTGLKTLGLARNSLKSKTAKAFLETLNFHGNVSLSHLSLSGNPDLPLLSERTISYLVRANRAGRYLLRNDAIRNKIQRSPCENAINMNNDNTNKFLNRTVGVATANVCQCNSGNSKETNEQGSNYRPKLWPLVFEGLDPDMIYFFLREKPTLHHSK